MKKFLQALLIAVSVYCLLIALFSQLYFPRATGRFWHELVGTLVLVVVVVHVILLRSFFSYMLQQRSPYFIYRDIILALLFIDFIVVMVFGIAMSKIIFPDLIPIPKSIARQAHTTSAIYLYLLIGMHLGCYFSKLVAFMKDSFGRHAGKVMIAALSVVALNGLLEMIKPYYIDVLTYSFRALKVDRERSIILNTIDQMSVSVLFMLISYAISSVLLKFSTKKEPKESMVKAVAKRNVKSSDINAPKQTKALTA